ncbi:biofilm regulation diguanylate cyclase SiaD [Dechloromonas sp. ZY10]|uniref:biofilm regulation diguanylate cyclase SiaD n=1 Tax=Dechloromonas aquae TaxID=2664436 RepID=UPI0035290485
MNKNPPLEERIEALLRERSQAGNEWHAALSELYDRYRSQERLLERITRISDLFQRAERDRGQSYAEQLERKVRQIEKIVRISDRYQLMLRDLNDRLTNISTHDELTGLPNRRFMQEKLQYEISRMERQGTRFSIALADIDHFKRINDSAGHGCGDTVLRALAECLRNNLREYDSCARWGGEEFLLLFPDCELTQAAKLAERIRVAVQAFEAEGVPQNIRPTISFGVSEYAPGKGLDQALREADLALYQAKADGRNRVVSYQEQPGAGADPGNTLP